MAQAITLVCLLAAQSDLDLLLRTSYRRYRVAEGHALDFVDSFEVRKAHRYVRWVSWVDG